MTVCDVLSTKVSARSRFGVVVLSGNFFAKQWPQRELDGLVAIETTLGRKVILPIWHNLSKQEICEYSPTLADLVAVSSSGGMDNVVKRILGVVRPQGSPLIVARDRLIELGAAAPVVTDEWWLDVVEASNRPSPWGLLIDTPAWNRWAFPLPERGTTPHERGERLAWTAAQLAWTSAAEERRITQVSKPDDVLSFIDEFPGLQETCVCFPKFLASYAPQLTIRGFGGPFEDLFSTHLAESERRHTGYTAGSGLTTTGRPPTCDVHIALRHPTFGDYEPASIACQFVQGDIGDPPVLFYPRFEYLAWLLSDASSWLPKQIHDCLLEGMKQWNQWLWMRSPFGDEDRFIPQPYDEMGSLAEALLEVDDVSALSLSDRAKADLSKRLEHSISVLRLPDTARELTERFYGSDMVTAFLEERREFRRGTRS